ncbi:MAG: hypothetical protein HKO59_13130 [Phycisphaerales bacterium]|nr:hypothetical protein [Phycisphaerae bacterium]NNF45055.1 hypothetical protein [Phycisphaerales bacterium]NNM26905.1 hypothetical protein [Phycisphaerales bacterium]
MNDFRLRTDIQRACIGDFALPLGLVPDAIDPPLVGYTLDYTQGDEERDEPDTYTFYIVTSHERLKLLVDRMLDFLPERVHAILEVGSRDAYRALDVFMAPEAIDSRGFREVWEAFEPFLLEDGSIGAGANSDDPFVEIFLDQWKGLSVHVPLLMRDDVEAVLAEFGLQAVPETWPVMDEDTANRSLKLRSVLAGDDDTGASLEDLLLELRHGWELELNVDPETNVDDSGRDLGPTLWHTLVIVESSEDPAQSAYASIWATARSLAEMDELIDDALSDLPEWRVTDVYTIDRVAYDERPDALDDLPPRRKDAAVHLVELER